MSNGTVLLMINIPHVPGAHNEWADCLVTPAHISPIQVFGIAPIGRGTGCGCGN